MPSKPKLRAALSLKRIDTFSPPKLGRLKGSIDGDVVLLLPPFLLKPHQFLILGKTINTANFDERQPSIHQPIDGAPRCP